MVRNQVNGGLHLCPKGEPVGHLFLPLSPFEGASRPEDFAWGHEKWKGEAERREVPSTGLEVTEFFSVPGDS